MRSDPHASPAVSHHHPEVRDPSGEVDTEMSHEDAISLRDERGCVLGIEASIEDPTGPVTIDRRLRADPTTLARDLLEQGEPLVEVALDRTAHLDSDHLTSISRDRPPTRRNLDRWVRV